MFLSNTQLGRCGYGADYTYDSYNNGGGGGAVSGTYQFQQARRGNRNGGGGLIHHNNNNNNRKRATDESHHNKIRDVGGNRDLSSSSTSTISSVSSHVSASISGSKSYCNLDRFLESTAPTAPLQYLPKTTIKLLKVSEAESLPFYNLGDLWESFNEWSAYGAGVPITLNGSDTAIQYYVPYLSAIQLYVSHFIPDASARRIGEESDTSDCDFRDNSSEVSSCDEADRDSMNGIRHWRNSKCSDGNLRLDGLPIRGQGKDAHEGFFSDDGEGSNGLFFEYFEHATPYCREPLADKITDLAKTFPRLKTLRSIDLSPCSWLSVAWYPIYRIPTGPTLRDLAACFLTFHRLSTLSKDGCGQCSISGKPLSGNHIITSGGLHKIALPAFGLASYKFKGTVWSTTGTCERQRADSLLKKADEWLRLHQVQHPDYDFFLSHSTTYRR